MGRNIGSFIPSEDAQGNLIRNLIAIQQLQESRTRGKYLDELRKESTEKRKLETEKMEREARATELNNLAQTYTGLDPTKEPEVQPYMFEARQMAQPGGQATTTTGPIPRLPENVTTIPNIYRHPATVDDRAGAMSRGAQEMKGAQLKAYETHGLESDDPLVRQAQTSKIITPPGKVPGVIQEREKTAQAALETRGKTVDTRIKEATEPDVIAGTRGVEAKKVAEGEVAARSVEADIAKRAAESKEKVAEAKIKEAESVYAESNARASNKIKVNEALIKEAEKNRQPDLAVKLKQENRNLQLDAVTKQQAIDKHNNTLRAFIEYDKAAGNPGKQREILHSMAAMNGMPNIVLSDNIAVQNATAEGLVKAQDLRVGAMKLATTPGGLDEAKRAYETANKMLTNVARMNNSPTVVLTTMSSTPGGYGGFGADVGKAGSITVPTTVSEAYNLDLLRQIASGKMTNIPLGLQNAGVRTPADALAWDVGIRYAYGGNDPAVFNKGISDAEADPLVKDQALRMVKAVMDKMSPTAAPAAPTGPSWSSGFKENVGEIATGVKPVTEFLTRPPAPSTLKPLPGLRSQRPGPRQEQP